MPDLRRDTFLDDALCAFRSTVEFTAESPTSRTGDDFASIHKSGCSKRKRAGEDQDEQVHFKDGQVTSIQFLVSLLKEHLEESMETSLRTLVSVLTIKEESEVEYRQQLLKLEEQRLTLKREKLRYKQQRIRERNESAPKKTSTVDIPTNQEPRTRRQIRRKQWET